MTDPGATLSVTRDDEDLRYVLRVDGDVAGFAEFELQAPDGIRFTHTVIQRAFRGRGLGEVLASDALADAARRGETIIPVCSFIAGYLQENEVAGAVIDWPHSSQAQDSAAPPETPE